MVETLSCPHCNREIPLSHYAKVFAGKGGRMGGRSCSEAKKRASKENGRKGGRPKKKP